MNCRIVSAIIGNLIIFLRRKEFWSVFNKKAHYFEKNEKIYIKGEKLNYKVVAMEEFQTSYNGFLNFLGYDFWSRSFS